MKTQLTIDGHTVDIIYKPIKNVHLSVRPPHGTLRLSAPYGTSAALLRAFVVSKRDWIRRRQSMIRAQPREAAHSYHDGERHVVLGQSYPLRIVTTSRRQHVTLSADTLTLCIKAGADQAEKAALLQTWYRQQLRIAAEPLIADWAAVMQVSPKGLYIQRMKTRWGSCNTSKQTIRLNSELAKKPLSLVTFVIVHELTHLHERGHNSRFYQLMDRYLPDWRDRRRQLNALPLGNNID